MTTTAEPTLSYPFLGDPSQPVEVRSIEQREISGRIIPIGERITVRGRPESFAPGSLSGINPGDVRLLAFHDRNRPVGRLVGIEQREDGYYGRFRVSRTALGDEMLELAGDGVLSFSPGFLPGEQSRDGVHTRIAALPEISLVTSSFGAYPGAQVLAVREENPNMPEPQTETAPAISPATIPATTEPAVETRESEELARIETRVGQIATQLERLQSVADAPVLRTRQGVGPSPFAWFRAEIDALAGRFERREQLAEDWAQFQTRVSSGEIQLRELADITGDYPEAVPADDISGLVIEEFIASQLVNVLDRRRRISSRLGAFPMPRSGHAKIPVVTQHTEVDVRAGQKEDANSRKMIITTAPFDAVWYDGAVDIALEVIRSAELPVIAMVWEDLLGQYAIASEAGTVSQIEAGALGFTYTGAALPTGDYATFATAVATQALEVEEGSGAPATLLAVTKAQWPALVAMVDANDRRQFAPIGAQNADATVAINATSFTLPGGVEVFYGGPGLTQAFITNSESLRFSDGGPEQVEATNVEKMGKDLGLLGRTMFVPRIPAGVIVFGDNPESS